MLMKIASAALLWLAAAEEAVVIWHSGPRVTAWQRFVLERYRAALGGKVGVLRDVTGLRGPGVRFAHEPLRDYATNATSGGAVDVCEVTWDSVDAASFGARAAAALLHERVNPRPPRQTFRVEPHSYHGPYQLLWWRHCAPARPKRVWFVENDAVFLGDVSRFFAALRAEADDADLVSAGFRIAGEHWWEWPLAVAPLEGGDPFFVRRNGTSPVRGVPVLGGLSTGGCTDRQRIPDDEAGLLFRQDHVDRLSADLLDALERAFVDDGFLLPSEAWASTVCARLDFCDIYDFAPLRAPKDGARGYKRPWVTANYCWWAPPGFFFSRRPHCGGGAGAWQDRWIHPVKTTCASALSCDPSDRSREGLHCLFPDKAKPSDAEWPKTGYDDAARRAYADMFEKKQAPTKARDAPRRKKATPEKAARGKRDAAEPS